MLTKPRNTHDCNTAHILCNKFQTNTRQEDKIQYIHTDKNVCSGWLLLQYIIQIQLYHSDTNFSKVHLKYQIRIFATYDNTHGTVLQWVFSPKHTKYHRQKRYCMKHHELSEWHVCMKRQQTKEEESIKCRFRLHWGIWQYMFDVWLAFVYILWSASVCNVNTGVFWNQSKVTSVLLRTKRIHNAKPGQSNADPYKIFKAKNIIFT